MRFDKAIGIIGKTRVSDGMGGFETIEAPIKTIQAFTTFVTVEEAQKEYGIVTKNTLKVFTKDSIPKNIESVEFDGAVYSVVRVNDFGRKLKTFVIVREG